MFVCTLVARILLVQLPAHALAFSALLCFSTAARLLSATWCNALSALLYRSFVHMCGNTSSSLHLWTVFIICEDSAPFCKLLRQQGVAGKRWHGSNSVRRYDCTLGLLVRMWMRVKRSEQAYHSTLTYALQPTRFDSWLSTFNS